jgi:hypothetical protein
MKNIQFQEQSNLVDESGMIRKNSDGEYSRLENDRSACVLFQQILNTLYNPGIEQ